MIPTSSLDPGAIITNDQRIFSIQKFIEINPFYELQDLYQWLYFGEFGSVMEKTDKPSARTKPELIKILEELKIEKEMQSDDVVWESMGLSFRFVMVYLTPYSKQQCPITRIINLLDRSPAFRGTRVHFKLDWVFVKEYIIKNSNKFTKFDFYGFEDRYNFHQLPTIPFTETYFKAKPKSFRILPRKLFFEFFPEFDTREDVLYTRPKDSLID